jgi:hypothetical protein
VLRLDKAKDVRYARERFRVAVTHAESPAHRDIVTDQAIRLHDRDETEVL